MLHTAGIYHWPDVLNSNEAMQSALIIDVAVFVY